jgi:hypothetical protein
MEQMGEDKMGKLIIINNTTGYERGLWYTKDICRISNLRSKLYNNLKSVTKNINDEIIFELNGFKYSIDEVIEEISKKTKRHIS